jgi:Tetratricopeptide repeat.
MDNYQYHLTFNGKFTNETYIEYFNPNYLDKDQGDAKGKAPSDKTCTDALTNLKEALNSKGVSEKECEKRIRELRDMLCDDPYKPNCNSSGSQKESKNLYFFEEYQKSIAIIKEIISDWPCPSKNTDPCQRMKCQWDNLSVNNRILFHGQRGSGKTSVTMSVAKSLEGHGIGCSTFKVLPIINPCYFDNDTNILKTILSNMFEMAKCIIKKEDNDSQRNEHEELLKQFEEVYRLLGCIESPNKEKHTLETLNEISKASGMREAMQKLVDKFIKILPCKAKYLVLVIDDVDMSVAYAATMLEQINKFLELDNLIILISANLDQLYNEMREHYSKAFEKTLGDENQSPSIDVEDLSSKYLLKLFPASRRINVERPVSKLLQTELILNDENKGGLQKAVLSLIWDKTRLLYIPKDAENTLHPVIPTNLRELAQLINLLQGMEEVETGLDENKQMLFADKRAYENCQKNINTFKNYFLNIWVPTHLSVDEEQVFLNIPSDITEINKHLINSINVIGTKNKKRLMSREVGLDMIVRNAEDVNIDRDIYTMVSPNDPRFVKANKISDIFNRPSNYSYGDLLLMIDKYETYFESEENRRFSNAIKIYYSILLFETMFFKSNDVKYDKKEYDSIRMNGMGLIPIQKLIGGTVYYPNYFEIITSKYFAQKGPSFDAKRAFYHKIESNNKSEVGKKCPLFSVLYYGDIRPDRYDTKHIFDTTYERNADVEGTKYVTFDILSVLNNMLNPWHTVSRADVSDEDSIWNNDIKSWGDFCAIQGKCVDDNITTPNPILPFYSVDLMLLILKKQFDDEYLVEGAYGKDCYKEKYAKLKCDKEIIAVVRDMYYASISKVEDISINVKNVSYSVKDCEVIVQKKDNKGYGWDRSFNGAVSYYLVNILTPLSQCYLQLLSDNKQNNVKSVGFKGVNERISLPDLYRNYCISLILSYYKGGSKDREALIKGLKKNNTPSEMYKYLVDQLWEKEATESFIRGPIQEAIHDKKTVAVYYGELMNQVMWLIDGSCNHVEVYREIFDLATEFFINPDPGKYYLDKGDEYCNNEYNRAISYYNKAIDRIKCFYDLNGDNDDGLKKKYSNAFVKRGDAFYSIKDYDKAIGDYSEAIIIDPQNHDASKKRKKVRDEKRRQANQ